MFRTLLVVLAGGALTACGGLGQSRPAATETRLTISGGVTVDAGYATELDAPACDSAEGYDDIGAGGQVTVLDAAGKIVGIGALGAGKRETVGTDYEDDPGTCRFPLKVTGVPPTSEFYSVEVGHRNPVRYSKAELASGVNLTLD